MAPEQVSHYELVRLIGRGGMGEVHEARDLTLRRRVALKFLSPDMTADPAALARFEREAHAAAELNHPHIATVFAFEPDGERPFIAMELLAGPSLRERLDGGPLALAEALAIAGDVAAALAYAHRRGIAHRDIKPENLMFDEHGEIKIMDFGLARATMASKLTLTGSSLGTPAYMSPEAIRGDAGPPSDVFALGLVLWEMLAGYRAYPGDNVMAVMFAIANDPPPAIRERRDDVPDTVALLLDRLLAKDAADRLDAAGAAAELAMLTGAPLPALSGTFVPAAGGSSATPSPAELSTMRTQAVPRGGTALSTGTADALKTATVPRARVLLSPRRVLVASAVVVLVLGGGAAAVWWAARARTQAEAAQLNDRALAAGDRETGRRLFEQALLVDPTNVSALSNLGLMAAEDKRFPLAESLLGAALDHTGRGENARATALTNLASVDMDRGYYARAIERLREAYHLDSTAAGSYNNLGFALIQNKQPADALTLLRIGIERFPGEAFLFKNAAIASRELGDLPEAIRYVNAAVRLDSTFESAIDLRRTLEAERSAGR